MAEKEKRENVINGLKCCKEAIGITDPICGKCPYKEYAADCVSLLAADAFELLKAQEPVKPKKIPNCTGSWCECGWFLGVMGGVKYCANCGREVKWE